MDERWGKNVETKNFFHLTPLLFSMNLFSTSESPHTMLYFIVELLQINIAKGSRGERESWKCERKIACGLLYSRKKRDIFLLSQCEYKKIRESDILRL